MVSGLGTEAGRSILGNGLFIPEFGLVNLSYLDATCSYQVKLFRLSPEVQRAVCEALNFTANFDLGSVRTAYLDVVKNSGYVVFEIERNTKPSDIGLRYMKERWQVLDVQGRDTEGLRPWIKSEYFAKFLPEKVLVSIAESLKVKAETLAAMVVRLNLKDRSFGLIIPESIVEQCPAGAFFTHKLLAETIISAGGVPATSSLTAPSMASVPNTGSPFTQVELGGKEDLPVPKQTEVELLSKVDNSAKGEPSKASTNDRQIDVRQDNRSTMPPKTVPKQIERIEIQPKYATYSRSEIDNMFKQQTETVAQALGAKISSQQRVFQESVEKQEKSFARLTDNLSSSLENGRGKLEQLTVKTQEGIKSELESFRRELSKELQDYRSHFNKAVLPAVKALDEKPVAKATSKEEKLALSAMASLNKQTELLRLLVLANIAALVVGLSVLALFQSSQVNSIEQKLQALSEKVAR